MSLWSRLFGDRPIVTRLVLAVAVTMTVVLSVAGAFVYWRVEYALNRQLNQDLDAYHEVVTRDLSTGETPPVDTPGLSYQLYDGRGRVLGGDAKGRNPQQGGMDRGIRTIKQQLGRGPIRHSQGKGNAGQNFMGHTHKSASGA